MRYGLASMSRLSAQSEMSEFIGSTMPIGMSPCRIGPSVWSAACICSTLVALFGFLADPDSMRYSNSRAMADG
jgi:hypothetical protein